MFNVSALLLDDARLKCVVTEVVTQVTLKIKLSGVRATSPESVSAFVRHWSINHIACHTSARQP